MQISAKCSFAALSHSISASANDQSSFPTYILMCGNLGGVRLCWVCSLGVVTEHLLMHLWAQILESLLCFIIDLSLSEHWTNLMWSESLVQSTWRNFILTFTKLQIKLLCIFSKMERIKYTCATAIPSPSTLPFKNYTPPLKHLT